MERLDFVTANAPSLRRSKIMSRLGMRQFHKEVSEKVVGLDRRFFAVKVVFTSQSGLYLPLIFL